MATSNWRMSLVVVGSIIFTVIAGLMLSQLDYLELPYLLPTVQAVAGNELIIDVTDTPLPAIPLPSEAPTSTATNTVVASPTSAETAVTESISCNQAPSFWVRYIVQPGDTLSSLSSLYGLTSGEIALANCLQAGQSLMSGMAIKLPWSWIQSPTCIAPLTWVQYQVMPGDTLYSLAIKRGTTIQDVMNANCLFSSNDLFFGKTILLPPLVMTPVMPTVTLTPTATITATASATAVTQTPTPSTTWTPTATATIVFSPTVTATPTGTWIETPTSTATSTATDTPSGTPTSTPTSMTGTVTATPTETNTPISSATPPPTLPATEIPTSVPTETATPLPTALPTNTAVPTETPVSP